MKKSYLQLLIVCVFSSQVFFAQTEKPKNNILTDRFLIGAGVFLPIQNVKVGAHGEIPIDDLEDIEFGEIIGSGDFKPTFHLNFMWRFSKSKRWSLKAEYFKIKNEGSAVLNEDIEWNDLIFKAGSNIDAGTSLALYKVFFGRVISTGQKHELGAGLGIHAINASAFIQGEGYVNDDTITLDKNNVSVVAPLPNIGFWYIYAPIEKLSFEARLDWFGITVGDFGGSLWNLSAGVNYQFLRNLGVSASYKYFNLDINVDKDSWNGGFDISLSGPALSVVANF